MEYAHLFKSCPPCIINFTRTFKSLIEYLFPFCFYPFRFHEFLDSWHTLLSFWSRSFEVRIMDRSRWHCVERQLTLHLKRLPSPLHRWKQKKNMLIKDIQMWGVFGGDYYSFSSYILSFFIQYISWILFFQFFLLLFVSF